jgi:ABC-2 type transport system permease protein
MADRKRRLTSLALTLGLVGLNLAALNFLLAGWSTARLDLTEDGVFSVSSATKRLLTNLDEDLTVYGYFSKRTHPKLAPLIPEIVDMLDEYRAVARGRLHVEILDPGENEDVEEEAADRFGVRSTPFRLASKYEAAIVNAYFALVVKYGDQYVRYGFEDLIQVESTPDGNIEVGLRNLEYDLTRAIKKVVYGFRSTHELFERIEEPVKLVAIWTPQSLPEVFREVPDAVRTAVDELKKAGGERFVFEEIDPSQAEPLREQVYQRWGAQPMSLGLFSDGEFYLYAMLQVGDRIEQIVLTGESATAAEIRESVESSLRRHTPGFLKTVGVVTPDPPQIPPEIRMQMQLPPQAPPEFEEVKRLLEQDYQVREVDLAAGRGVPAEVDMLLVIKPRSLEEKAVYNLDQYLMRGGRVILCAGNYDVSFDAGGLRLSPLETGLDDWLAHFGLTVEPTLVLDERNQPLPIPQTRSTPFGTLRTWTLAPYPYLVQVRDDGLRNPTVTASLDAVGIYWGSPLKIDAEAAKGLEVFPILQSSERSWTDDNLAAVAYVDHPVPAEGTEPHLLAVALSGRFKSPFAGRKSPFDSAATAAGPDEPAAAPEKDAAEPPRVTLQESPDTRLVVVGNAEFLSDFVARALARVDGGFFAENLRFAQNLLDWAGLDSDMLAIRARGTSVRRLAPIGKNEEVVIEAVNYAIPVVLLLALGGYLGWKRRRTVPLTAGADPSAPMRPISTGEVGR